MSDTSRLNIEQDTADPTLVRVAGELDPASAPDLREHLIRLVEGGSGNLTLDLSEVDFLDSTGLRELLAADGLLRDRGDRLVIAEASAAVERVVHLTGLSEHFGLPEG